MFSKQTFYVSCLRGNKITLTGQRVNDKAGHKEELLSPEQITANGTDNEPVVCGTFLTEFYHMAQVDSDLFAQF